MEQYVRDGVDGGVRALEGVKTKRACTDRHVEGDFFVELSKVAG